jgi:hypothetical protein
MTEGEGRIVELTLSVPDGDEDAVAGLVNLATMTHARPIRKGEATLTRITFLDGSHVDVTEPLADVARLVGIATRRPQRRFWDTPASRPGAPRPLRSGTPPESQPEGRVNGVHA